MCNFFMQPSDSEHDEKNVVVCSHPEEVTFGIFVDIISISGYFHIHVCTMEHAKPSLVLVFNFFGLADAALLSTVIFSSSMCRGLKRTQVRKMVDLLAPQDLLMERWVLDFTYLLFK